MLMMAFGRVTAAYLQILLKQLREASAPGGVTRQRSRPPGNFAADATLRHKSL